MMLKKRSFSLHGHATSIALEPAFWTEVERLAATHGQRLSAFIATVDDGRGAANLASALRVLVLADLTKDRSTAAVVKD
jgi:predicted DNA-binding ribbon-helix-helix protein